MIYFRISSLHSRRKMSTEVSSSLNNDCKDINDVKQNIVWFDGEVRIKYVL